jgi:hypothetical protein
MTKFMVSSVISIYIRKLKNCLILLNDSSYFSKAIRAVSKISIRLISSELLRYFRLFIIRLIVLATATFNSLLDEEETITSSSLSLSSSHCHYHYVYLIALLVVIHASALKFCQSWYQLKLQIQHIICICQDDISH